MNDEVYFVADAHLLPGSQGRKEPYTKPLVSFLRGIRNRAAALYVVGDLFDFWFEYSCCVPWLPFEVLRELSCLVDTGTKVTLVAGNHDYWTGEFLTEEVGLEFSPTPLRATHQGVRILLSHGDEITAAQDPGYRLLRAVVRSRLARSGFRLIHPDIGIRIARVASLLSRQNDRSGRYVRPHVRERIEEYLTREDVDGVVLGHIHLPLQWETEHGTCLILGDWRVHRAYGVLSDGVLSLHHWREPGD